MKIIKLLLASLLTTVFAAGVQADTVRFTGSTAYRGTTHAAIQAYMLTQDPNATMGFTGSSLSGASQAVFTAPATGLVIKTSWSGSEAGIQTVAFGGAPLTVNFLADGASQSLISGGGTSGVAAGVVAEIPDVAMSDTLQSTSNFNGRYRSRDYPPLTASPNSPVGVVAFKFVASKSAPGTFNVTSQTARNLFSTGKVSYALFTGNSADRTSTVYGSGRDPLSGTRLTAFAEIGLGALASTTNYYPTKLSGAENPAKTIGGALDYPYQIVPNQTINGITYFSPNGGYSSGGDLTKMLANTTPNSTFFVSYGGTDDVDTNSLPNGCFELSYNGVLLGTPASNGVARYDDIKKLTEGSYTFWGYERMYYRGTPGPSVQATADAVALEIKTNQAPIKISAMSVSRSSDGGIVTQNYASPF